MRRHSSVSTFVFLPRLGLACEIGIHPGIRLVDPNDAALPHRCCRQPLPPLSPTSAAAAAAVGRWPLPLPLLAAAAAGHCRHCCQLSPPLTAAAAAAGLYRRCRRPLPPLTAIVVERCRCRCRRRTPPLPPLAAAAAVDARLCQPTPSLWWRYPTRTLQDGAPFTLCRK